MHRAPEACLIAPAKELIERSAQPIGRRMSYSARATPAAALSAVFAFAFFAMADDIPLSENDMVARADHGMIRPGTRSRRGPQMSPTPDSTLDDPQQIIADLKRQLAEDASENCRA